MELAIPLISPAVQIIGDNLKINSVTRGSTTSRKREFTANKYRQHLRKETKNLWSLKDAGSAKVISGVTAYFLAMNMGVGVRVNRLLSFTLAELQAIALALECIPFSCAMILYLDSQSEAGLGYDVVLNTMVNEIDWVTTAKI
ncbi:hypothetical protein G9A89_003019 [Geosiphon pyriformis]|nr:hypothetical protein G9A89_003019 [Geosiphon pyriformis]